MKNRISNETDYNFIGVVERVLISQTYHIYTYIKKVRK